MISRQKFLLLSLSPYTHIIVGIVLLACLTLIFHFHRPGSSSLLPPCWFFLMTDLHCPGCGITRSLYALFSLQPLVALSNHAVFILSIPVIVMLWIDRFVVKFLDLRLKRHLVSAQLWAIVVICFFVFRNIPYPPFNWLAPVTVSV